MTSCMPLDYLDINYEDSSPTYENVYENFSKTNTTPVPYEDFQSNVTYDFDEELMQKRIFFENFESVIYQYITPLIATFGCIGNILNLIILTRKTVTVAMHRMEKSSHTGLTALALSDLLFCLFIIPHAWVPAKQFSYSSKGFSIYYSIFSEAFINIFLMSSTLLTVIIAVSRYFAVAYPIKARDLTGMTFTVSSISLTFLISILANMPRFWNESINAMDCVGGFQVYFRENSWFKEHATTRLIYLSLYFALVILLPFLTLTYCNVFLVKALKQSIQMREQYQPTSKKVKDSTHRITLTMVIIIIMYIILVIPGETIHFLINNILQNSTSVMYYNFLLSILNVFQVINFSFNFILYCVVNVHFRKTVMTTFCPRYVQKVAVTSEYTSVNTRSMTATTQF